MLSVTVDKWKDGEESGNRGRSDKSKKIKSKAKSITMHLSPLLGYPRGFHSYRQCHTVREAVTVYNCRMPVSKSCTANCRLSFYMQLL